MKLLFAIVDREDANTVVRNLSHRGFSSTKLATTGGFLLSNNITLMVGVEDKMVQTVIDIIKEHSHSRKQVIPTSDLSFDFDTSMPLEVSVGGRHHLRGGRGPVRKGLMRFPGFLGNSGLKARLSAAGDRGALSHCYILEGPQAPGKRPSPGSWPRPWSARGRENRPAASVPPAVRYWAAGTPT